MGVGGMSASTFLSSLKFYFPFTSSKYEIKRKLDSPESCAGLAVEEVAGSTFLGEFAPYARRWDAAMSSMHL